MLLQEKSYHFKVSHKIQKLTMYLCFKGYCFVNSRIEKILCSILLILFYIFYSLFVKYFQIQSIRKKFNMMYIFSMRNYNTLYFEMNTTNVNFILLNSIYFIIYYRPFIAMYFCKKCLFIHIRYIKIS